MTERGQVFGPGLQAGSTAFVNPANPTGTTSLSGVMMGLGATCTITTKVSTRVCVIMQGGLANNTAADGAVVNIQFGSGTAPANGAAAAGGSVGGSATASNIAVANTQIPFCCVGVITTAGVGTPIWVDLLLAAVTGGTASVLGIGFTAFEV